MKYSLAVEKALERRLFSNRKAIWAILAFIATTEIELREGEAERKTEQVQRDDKWNLEALNPAEQEGEG